VTYPDIAEIVQNQIIAAVKSRKVASEPFQRPQVPDLDLYMAALEKVAAEAEVRSERWRQQAEAAVKRAEISEAKVASQEQAISEGKVQSEQWHEQTEANAELIESLQENIAALKENLTEAEAIAERRRQEAEIAAKRADDLVAELYELTCEHVEMVAPKADAAQEGTQPEDIGRVELRRAIAARKAANARYQHLETAVELAHEVCRCGQRLLSALSDVDVSIVQYRADEFKRVAAGGPLAALSLPEHLETRRTMRDVAAEQLTRARAACDDLVDDAAQAKAMTEQASLGVAKSACAVLLEEGARQGFALKEAWEELWCRFDRAAALADCQLHYADASFPITLPSETANLLHTLAALDCHQLAHRDDAASAGEAWCLWFRALLGDAEAQLNFGHATNLPKDQLATARSSALFSPD
jgi:hypothetical protein